ncbi:MAG: HK97 gp10 family phage protein [Methyloceanibacter sp.]
MTAVTIRGLAALQQRLEGATAPEKFAQAVRQEAETLAAEARERAPGELGQSVEIRDVSRVSRPAYAIGTPHPAGRFLEFGTARRPASPWLMPLFWARSPSVKDRLRKVVLAALKI